MKRILIVGAGFSGAVVARELADRGYGVSVIDRRDHIGGNAYDERDARTGINVHRYGPHIFHTSSSVVIEWLSRFTAWSPYRHRVKARVEAVGLVPLPINIDTINAVFGTTLDHESAMRDFLDRIRIRHDKVTNARHYAESIFGVELTELFFARYTKKMWGFDLEDMPPSILARLPVRYSREDEYFNDSFQAMPADGYAAIFRAIFDHPNITVSTGVRFSHDLLKDFDHAFLSMSIDEYFGYEHGYLPYRSIKFQHQHVAGGTLADHAVPTINLTDTGPITRRTRWLLYPGSHGSAVQSDPDPDLEIVTDEVPCPLADGGEERYYPMLKIDGSSGLLYSRYEEMARGIKDITFIGRCGTYRYFDMHQVIASSLVTAKRFME